MAFKVFISHSVADHSLVYQLKYWLDLNGIQTYVAEFYPAPGMPLGDKIAAAIRDSDCVIAVLTRDGARSNWVHQEIGAAKLANRPVIPLVEKGVPLVGFVDGVEYIPVSPDDPRDAITRVIDYLVAHKANKETQEKATAAILIILGLLGLTLAAADSKQG